MYNEQETAFIIKQTAKIKNITIKQLLENCNLSINTVSELSKGKRMSYISFAKIAEALDCSMDYLMGRTDNPNISGNYINGDNNVQAIRTGNGDMTIHAEKQLSKGIEPTTEEFIKIFCDLDFDDKFEVMQLLMQKRGEKK